MSIAPRSLVLVLATVGILLGGLATFRLGAVVSATPASLWLDPYPRMSDPNADMDAGARERATFLAGLLGDASLLRGAIDMCLRTNGGPEGQGPQACVETIDRALRAVPSSGELWLQKARLLLLTDGVSEPVFTALRESWRVAPREGWIAGARVVVGVRIYPSLPADLQQAVTNDILLVMQNPPLNAALVASYAADPAFRQIAAPVLAQLPPEVVHDFAELVADRIETPPST